MLMIGYLGVATLLLPFVLMFFLLFVLPGLIIRAFMVHWGDKDDAEHLESLKKNSWSR